MKKQLYYLAAMLIIPFGITLMQGCYPNDSLSAEETDLVLTFYNDSVDFNTLSTYYINDTVYTLGDDEEQVPLDNSAVIVNQIVTNMTAAGYTRITIEDETKPSVVVLTGAFKSTTVSVGWYYPYYGWGGGWGWGWGWGGYYPGWGYGGYPYYSSYSTGTVVIDMVNPDDNDVIDGDTLARVYWNAGIQGVLNGGNTNNRIKKGIDQAFIQSPQIKTGN